MRNFPLPPDLPALRRLASAAREAAAEKKRCGTGRSMSGDICGEAGITVTLVLCAESVPPAETVTGGRDAPIDTTAPSALSVCDLAERLRETASSKRPEVAAVSPYTDVSAALGADTKAGVHSTAPSVP